jgi:predicted amidophosphoribosyltransferase
MNMLCPICHRGQLRCGDIDLLCPHCHAHFPIHAGFMQKVKKTPEKKIGV